MTAKWTTTGILGAALIAGTMAATAVDAREGDRGMWPGFGQIDADGDGRITAAEIEDLRAARFAELDADGDGAVSRDEFLAHAAVQASERAGRMFDRLDADGDGMLGPDALQARFGRGPDAERMIGRLDTDGDGAISAEEFAQARDDMPHRFGRHGGMGGRGPAD